MWEKTRMNDPLDLYNIASEGSDAQEILLFCCT